MPLSRYLGNLLVDFLWREQAYNPPATQYAALLTAAPDLTDAYTELGASGYARVASVGSLADWSGTQGAGTTSASSGSGAVKESSNNASLQFHASIPAEWNGLVALAFFDSDVEGSGNLLDWYYLTDGGGNPVTRNYAIGDPVAFAAGRIKRQITNAS